MEDLATDGRAALDRRGRAPADARGRRRAAGEIVRGADHRARLLAGTAAWRSRFAAARCASTRAPADDEAKFDLSRLRTCGRSMRFRACANGDLLATDGSATQDAEQWVRDLLERGRTGGVLRLDAKSGEIRVLASGLRYAFGVCASGDDVPGRAKAGAAASSGSPLTARSAPSSTTCRSIPRGSRPPPPADFG